MHLRHYNYKGVAVQSLRYALGFSRGPHAQRSSCNGSQLDFQWYTSEHHHQSNDFKVPYRLHLRIMVTCQRTLHLNNRLLHA